MQIIKAILYKPYHLFFIFLTVWLYYNSLNVPINGILTAVFASIVYTFFSWILFKYIRHSLLKVVNYISFFDTVPNYVISGYCFIIMVLFPLPTILIALISKLFLKEKLYQNTFTDKYGNTVTRIQSSTPSVFLTKRKGQEDEHIVVTKLMKKPKKITYE